jgi:hypothetical protein
MAEELPECRPENDGDVIVHDGEVLVCVFPAGADTGTWKRHQDSALGDVVPDQE